MQKRIVIIGSNGQIGRELVKALYKHEIIALTHKELDITNFVATRDNLMSINPDVVINTAAYHRVDECEKNPGQAYLVNAAAVKNLKDFCHECDICLVHFSSDYVFKGDKIEPYTEKDIPNPLNLYGRSKLEGEEYVRLLKKHLLIRTSYVFGIGGSNQKRTNLVETLLNAGKNGKIKAVNDHFFSPTYAKDLAFKICELLEKEKYGLYHITNSGECSVYSFAKKICEFSGINPEMEETRLAESNSNPEKAKRPPYSVLNSINLKNIGISPMRHWEEALKDYLNNKNGI